MSNQSIQKPNFFIIGAPKCGTTALWEWLRTHPQIFFPELKEPQFFNFDHYRGVCRTLEAYESLFKKAQPCHHAIGDATPAYLRSQTAIPAILGYAGQPKIVVSIRHPVDMAISLHNFQFLQDIEDRRDFWTAWQLQKQRRYGAHIPRKCDDVRELWYADMCCLGSQLKRLYAQVPKARIHIMQLEKIKADPQAEYRRLLDFLNVEDDDRDLFPVANAASRRKFKLIWSGYKLVDKAVCATGIKLPKAGIMSKLDQNTRKPIETQPPINASQRAELVDYLKDETKLAEQVTGLNLDHWRR